jgi:hypothetical protein
MSRRITDIMLSQAVGAPSSADDFQGAESAQQKQLGD